MNTMVSVRMLKRLLITAIVGIAAYIILMGDYSVFHVASHFFQKKEMLEEIATMEATRDDLIEQRERIEEDTLELERLAREKIGMVKEGERVFKAIVVDADSLTSLQREDTLLDRRESDGEGSLP